MTRFFKLCSKSCTVLLAAVALAGAAGCEKRPTGYDPTPGTPEGKRAPDARLVAFRNSALRVMVRDYNSPTADSAVVQASPLPGSAQMPVLLLVDGTPANSVELYRRASGGEFERTFDFALQSVFKYVDAGYETYFSSDPSPGPYAPSSYLTRGLVDGVASHASPLSNESRLTSAALAPIIYNGDRQPFDSLFVVSWVGVPDAVGYWIHIYEKPISGLERLRSSFPSPIAYITAADLLIGYREGNNPGGSVQFRLGDTSLLTLKKGTPLLGHDFLVRISAVDNTGHVFAQTPGDLDSVSLSLDMRFLAPPTFSPDGGKAFFSLGGTKVARRAIIRRGPAGITGGEESAPGQTLVRHLPLLPSPHVAPHVAPSRAGTPRRSGTR